MSSKTRRQEIVGEYRKEQIRVIALIAAALVLFIALSVSCANNCGTPEDSSAGSNAVSSGDDSVQSGAVDIDLLWTRLSAEDVQFIRSLTVYPRLVNTEHPLPLGYAPSNPTRLHGMPDGESNQLQFEAANAYIKLYSAMLEDGLAVQPLSGYRSYDEQVAIFNYNVQLHTEEGMTPEEAREYTEKFVAIPGTSEHQYGRSLDVTIDGTTNHSFHETEHGQWLIDHAHEYGFVIRYPADKVELTGINYEPWHLRWVDVEHADFMHRHNLCLEEYVALIQKYNPSAVMNNE